LELLQRMKALVIRVLVISLLLFAFLFPFERKIHEIFAGVTIALLFLGLPKVQPKKLLNLGFVSITAYFIISVFSIVYSNNLHESWRSTEKILVLFLFPLVMFLGEPIAKKQFNAILKSFVAGTLLISIIAFTTHLHRYFSDTINQYPYFFDWQLVYHNYVNHLGLHATFYAIFVAFSALITLKFLLESTSVKQKILYWLIFIFLLYNLLVSGARIVYAGFAIALFFQLYQQFKFNKTKLFGTLILLTALGSTVITFSPYLQQRLFTDVLWDLNLHPEQERLNKIEWYGDNRLSRWQCAVELIKEKPLFGYGTGDEKMVLAEKYREKGLNHSASVQFDAHSQYLSAWLRSGIFGFAAIIFMLFYGIKSAFGARNYLFLSFWLLIATAFLTENVLDSNKGVFFVAFFASLFFRLEPSEEA
jgi:O-antigen ligase